jgi:hypothetical protein
LKLVMTAGAVAAGLCLVIGMVTLVVALGGPSHGRTAGSGRGPASATGRSRPGMRSKGSQRTGGRRGKPATGRARISPRSFPLGRTLRHYSGSGTGEPGLFQVPAPGVWGLIWQYRCPSGEPADFVLGETRSSSRMAITVQRSARSGHGAYWVTGDTGPHSLVIASRCAWQLRVVLPATVS